MHIICEKEKLINGLDTVMKAVASRTTMPILECVLITADNNGLKFLCNNLEMGIESFGIEANIIKPGKIAINAKKVFEIAKKLPDGDVEISYLDSFMTIKSGRSKFKIICMDSETFPELPDVEKSEIYKIPSDILKNMIKETIFSISLDESKPVLMGELLEIKENKLNVVALDGFRISSRSEEMPENCIDASIIVPGKTLMDLSRILVNSDSEDVLFYMTEKHAMFELSECKIVTRLIGGSYINYENIFTEDYKTMVKINRQEFLECIERASLIFDNEKKRNPVKLEIKEDKIIVTSNTNDDQSYEEFKYLIDVLKAISSDTVVAYFTTAINPCIIKPFNVEKNEIEINARYLILPLKLR